MIILKLYYRNTMTSEIIVVKEEVALKYLYISSYAPHSTIIVLWFKRYPVYPNSDDDKLWHYYELVTRRYSILFIKFIDNYKHIKFLGLRNHLGGYIAYNIKNLDYVISQNGSCISKGELELT